MGSSSICSNTTIRLFWPQGLISYLIEQKVHSCVLLGPVLRCRQVDNTDLVLAAVVSWCCPEDARGSFGSSPVTVEVAGETHAAFLGAVGTWSSSDAAPATPGVASAVGDLWLVLTSYQQLHSGLSHGSSSSSSSSRCNSTTLHWKLPGCSHERCRLPPGASSLQIFTYDTLPGLCLQPRQQQWQQKQQPNASVPWMVRDPGGITLAASMQFVDQARNRVLQAQQQQPWQQQEAAQLSHKQQQQDNVGEDGWTSLAALHNVASCHHHEQHLQQWPLPKAIRAADRSAAVAACMRLLQQHSGLQGEQQLHAAVLLPALVQRLLSLAAAVMLLQHRQLLLGAAGQAGHWLQHEVLQSQVDWLMQARPAGIKLHIELSILLGTAAENILQLSGSICNAAWPLLGPAALAAVAAAAALGGASAGCTAAADVLLLVAWPLVLVYCLCARLHRLQLRCLRATWRLIRGKQKVRRFSERFRQQRQQAPAASAGVAAAAGTSCPSPPAAAAAAVRSNTSTTTTTTTSSSSSSQPVTATEGDEVSVEQLIVGVLLFTPLLGLMPTTSAWYLSLCCCHAGLQTLRWVLAAAGSLLQMRGLSLLISRWMQPQQFPGHLSVQPLAVCSAPRTSQEQQQPPQQKQQNPAFRVLYYRVFYEPCSYTELLLQQWYPHAAASHQGTSTGMAQLVEAVMLGRTWGLHLYSGVGVINGQ